MTKKRLSEAYYLFLQKIGNHLYFSFLFLVISGLFLTLGSQTFISDLINHLVHYQVPLSDYLGDAVMVAGVFLIGIGGGLGFVGSNLSDNITDSEIINDIQNWSLIICFFDIVLSAGIFYLIYRFPHFILPLSFLGLVLLIIPVTSLISIIIIKHRIKKHNFA